MAESIIPIKVKEIENNIEGKPLTDSEVNLFENSYRKYIEESKNSEEKFQETIEEMANLLTVNQKNIEDIKDQKWFSRSWNTITGKNKKLERINQTNLIKVQKGALFFLQNMAERNQATMETVTFAIKRIQDIQIESIKLKSYLTNIIQKYNLKLKKIEQRLDGHDEVIEELTKNNRDIPIILFSVLLLLTAIILFLLTDSLITKWIISSILFVFSLSFFFTHSIKKKNNNKNSYRNEFNQTESLQEVQKENLQLRNEANDMLYKYITNYINDDFAEIPFTELGNEYIQLAEYLKPASQDIELDKVEKSKIIINYVNIELCSYDKIISLINNNVITYINFHSKLTSDIINQYLPNSIGLDVLVNLDFQIQNQYISRLENTLSPYLDNFKELIEKRYYLINNYNRFNELYTESTLKSMGKVLLEGFTIGIIGDYEEENKFVDSYISEFENYFGKVDTLVNIIGSTIIQLHSAIYRELINLTTSKFQTIWDEFNVQNQSLKPLIKELNKS